jgi:HSP20 family protein
MDPRSKLRTKQPTITKEKITMRLVQYTYPNYRTFTPAGSVRSPWGGLEDEINQLLGASVCGVAETGRFPVDVSEDQANAYVRAELPGVRREDINVELADGTLTITATRRQKTGDREETFPLSRTLAVPETVQADKVGAAYENGVLTVTLPKAEAVKPRKIAVS